MQASQEFAHLLVLGMLDTPVQRRRESVAHVFVALDEDVCGETRRGLKLQSQVSWCWTYRYENRRFPWRFN